MFSYFAEWQMPPSALAVSFSVLQLQLFLFSCPPAHDGETAWFISPTLPCCLFLVQQHPEPALRPQLCQTHSTHQWLPWNISSGPHFDTTNTQLSSITHSLYSTCKGAAKNMWRFSALLLYMRFSLHCVRFLTSWIGNAPRQSRSHHYWNAVQGGLHPNCSLWMGFWRKTSKLTHEQPRRTETSQPRAPYQVILKPVHSTQLRLLGKALGLLLPQALLCHRHPGKQVQAKTSLSLCSSYPFLARNVVFWFLSAMCYEATK